jgi:hypothetical protein
MSTASDDYLEITGVQWDVPTMRARMIMMTANFL